MKTVYIPSGETVNYESLVADRVVVKGCLNIDGSLRAKVICGDGVIHAGEIHADTIRADDLESAGIICKRLIAKRVQAPEVIASDCAVVSCFLSAAYVETGKLTVAASEVNEIKADEVVNLRPKKRGMLRTLLASALRSVWIRLTAPKPKQEPLDAEYKTVTGEECKEEDAPVMEAKVREEIAKTVREVLEQERAAMADAVVYDGSDFELKRFISIFQLLRESGYTLRIIPGTPEENAPIFEPNLEQGFRPAA